MEVRDNQFSSSSIFFGEEKVHIIIVDDQIVGYVTLSRSAKTFNKLITEKRSELAQDFGCAPTEVYTINENGDHMVLLETPSRSYIWSGLRTRSKLEMKKVKKIIG